MPDKTPAEKNQPIRFFAQTISLGSGTTSIVTVTRAGSFSDPRYGNFEITPEMLLSMVKNYQRNTFGQAVFIDVSHQPEKGAAGTVTNLFVQNDKLMAEVEWTQYGIDAIKNRNFVYLSAEFVENFVDNEQGAAHGTLLRGAALTTRPVIKRLDPVQLAEHSGPSAPPTYFNPEVLHTLTEDATMTLAELIERLQTTLKGFSLAESVIDPLVAAFETTAKQLGEDQTKLAALYEQFASTGKQLAESTTGQPVTLSIQTPAGDGGLKLADVEKLIKDNQKAKDDAATKLAETLGARQKQFDDLIAADEGLKTLSEAAMTAINSARDLITADSTEELVKQLAAQQIALGNQIAVQSQLAAQGFQGPAGSVRISVDESNQIKSLQESVDKRLGLASTPDARRFSATGGALPQENKDLVEKVLAHFDVDNAPQLAAEAKQLAAGDGRVADVAVPAVYERTVIREALYQLVGLQFVDSGTLPFASSAEIPYSYRDTTAAGRNDTRTYEGQGINRAGVIQTFDTVYPIPQKISFEISDELRYLTGSGILDWNAVTENQRNATRIIAEDTEHLIFNEVLRASDEFGAVPVAAENLGPQTDGTINIVLLANFPVVRPRALFDMAGNAIGNVVNPITVMYNAVQLSEFDGSGNQPAGTYYVLDFNLGEISLVDEAGAQVTPGAATAFTISYSYSTNVHAFNTDPGATAVDAHWDNFLYRYGLRKSEIEDARYHMANFGLMRGALMTQIEQAKQFGANSRRPGTDLSADGNLGRVKDIPNFKATAPGLWMGDQRLIIGERGQTRFRMMKPWAMSELENQKDGNGRFTGQKEAYGDQFIVLHTPTPLKRAYTSMVVYSAAARVARV